MPQNVAATEIVIVIENVKIEMTEQFAFVLLAVKDVIASLAFVVVVKLIAFAASVEVAFLEYLQHLVTLANFAMFERFVSFAFSVLLAVLVPVTRLNKD